MNFITLKLNSATAEEENFFFDYPACKMWATDDSKFLGGLASTWVVETKQVFGLVPLFKNMRKTYQGGDRFTISGGVPYFHKRIPDWDPGLTREYSGFQEVGLWWPSLWVNNKFKIILTLFWGITPSE